MSKPHLFLATAVGICFAFSSANACSIVVDSNQTNAEKIKAARQGIDSATAIIDGEVVRSGENGTLALIYAHRSFKHADSRWFEVISGSGSDCRREFPQIGERTRLFLYKVPGGLVADDNGDSALQDRILKSNRRSEYPYFPGPRDPMAGIKVGSKQ